MPRPTLARLAWRPPGSALRTIWRVSCSRRWLASAWPMYPIAAAGLRSQTSSVARVDVTFAVVTTAIQYIRAGKLRALAVTGATRQEANIPAVADFLPGYEAS